MMESLYVDKETGIPSFHLAWWRVFSFDKETGIPSFLTLSVISPVF